MAGMKGWGVRRRLAVITVLGLVAAATVVASSAPASALTFTVDDTNDGAPVAADCTTPVPGSCSLRDAFAAANASAGDDIITLAASTTYGLTYCVLADGQDLPLTENATLTIVGNGATIDNDCAAAADSRVIAVSGTSGILVLQRVTITGGNPTTGGGGILAGGASSRVEIEDSTVTGNTATAGGAFDGGDVIVRRSTISENDATAADGGAISSFGDVTVESSTFSGNEANTAGGAIALNGGGTTLSITGSTFTGNEAGTGGGAISINGGGATATIATTTFHLNSAATGGALQAAGGGSAVSVTASTFSSNSASGLGGAYFDAGGASSLTLINSTMSGNTAALGGAYANAGGGSTLTAVYSTLVGNTAPDGANIWGGGPATLQSFGTVIGLPQGGGLSCTASLTSLGYSYEAGGGSCGFGAGPGDVSNGADPLLGALAANGGPTQTRLPAAGSPLLDRIPVAACGGPGAPVPTITADQRGVARPQGSGCDIGAVEAVIAALASDDLSFTG